MFLLVIKGVVYYGRAVIQLYLGWKRENIQGRIYAFTILTKKFHSRLMDCHANLKGQCKSITLTDIALQLPMLLLILQN